MLDPYDFNLVSSDAVDDSVRATTSCVQPRQVPLQRLANPVRFGIEVTEDELHNGDSDPLGQPIELSRGRRCEPNQRYLFRISSPET